MDQQLADVDIPQFTDPKHTRLTASRMLAWYESEPCGKLPTIFDVRRITDRRDRGRRGSRAHARNRQEALADQIGLTDGFQLLMVRREALLQSQPLFMELPEHVPTQLSQLGLLMF
jgi:hypothetical protein